LAVLANPGTRDATWANVGESRVGGNRKNWLLQVCKGSRQPVCEGPAGEFWKAQPT